MDEKEIEEREATAFYSGLMVGIAQARPNWSARRKWELFNALTTAQQRSVRELLALWREVPAIVSWVRSSMTAWEQHWSEVQTLEKMMTAGSEREGEK